MQYITADTVLSVAVHMSLLSCIAGALIGTPKGRTQAGALWGLLLGILGVLIALLLTPASVREAERSEHETWVKTQRESVAAENERRATEYARNLRPPGM